MRSIHKKTLKRFLSTLLALTMVLGMVPFTASAAAPVTLTQSGLTATITPSEPNPAAVTAGSTSAVTYTVMIEATDATASGKNVSLTIDGMVYDFGAVAISSSPYIITSAATVGSLSLTTEGKISGAVTKDYAPNSYNVTMSLAVAGEGTASDSATFTVDQKADLTLTATPDTVTAGQDFTVSTVSDIAQGYVKFTYGTDVQRVAVIPDENGNGIASATFTATGSGTQPVTALQYAMTGVVNTKKIATITVNAATVYHTITYSGNSLDAYNVPAAETVANGTTNHPVTTAVPNRTGYTFVGWAETAAATATDVITAISSVTTDITLYAVWAEETVAITWNPAPTGVSYVSAYSNTANKGSTVKFALTLTEGHDPNTLVVTANGVALAPVATGTAGQYQYSFVANANTEILVSTPKLLTYTVTMPVGHFTATITGVTGAGSTHTERSATVEYGGSYTFTVTPDAGYTIRGVYVNGAAQTGSSSYTVTNVTSAQTVEVIVDEIPIRTVTYVVKDAQYTTQKVTSGSAIGTLPDNPVVEGYTFNSWNIKQDGSGTTLATTTTVSQDMTVYAQLTANTYTITYNANAGSDPVSVPGSDTKTHGTAVALASEIPTRTGYTFLGWGTTAAATTATYQPGDMYSTEGSITLYAVWQINTFTVTLPNGTGYTAMPAAGSSSPVDYNGNFTFTVTVDPEYAVATPVVKANSTDLTGTRSGNTYTYTISNITADQVVSVSVTKNSVYTVTFQYTIGSVTTTYQTQQVEHGAKATVPNPPTVEGYTFGGWQWDDDNVASTPMVDFSFATSITKDITLYAVMTPITPAVTWDAPAANAGWTFDVTSADVTVPASDDIDVSPNTVKYGSKMEFNVVVKKGYDATNLAVAANGLALNPVLVTENGDGTTTYSFILSNITADQKITVTGVVRKTVTITYNANARDDVSDMPEQQVVNYYLSGASGNSKIIKQIPVRTGHTFLGWSTKSDYDGTSTLDSGDKFYAKSDIEGQGDAAVSIFTKDTTLYAVWQAKATTVTLTIQDYYNTNSGKPAQYEGQKITLVAEVKDGSNAAGKGTVTFYKKDINSATVKAVGSPVTIVDGKASLETTVGTFVNASVSGHTQYCETYWAVFTPEADEGYAAGTSENVLLRVYSSAISWKYQFDNNDDLTIYQADKTTPLGASDKMVAGQTYWLKLPDIVEMNGGKVGTLTPGTDYIVEWQYQTGENSWTTFKTTKDSDAQWVKITPDLVGHIFHALVIPNGVYTKAATYDSAIHIVDDVYASCLTSDPTAETVLQQTKTTLAITGADKEKADVKINGATPFNEGATPIGAHWAQFEGQKVTLEATVTDNATSNGVTVGYVNFYRYVATGDDELLNTTPVEVGANGVATFEVTISDYSTASGQTALTNVDRFYAVYLVNDTYDTSASVGNDGATPPVYNQPGDKDSVWIKSTAIQTPVIDAKRGTTDEGSTSYAADLEELLAGVKHTFKLRETGASGVTGQTSDWSVVALDGRTVASTDYTIQWLVTTGTNEEATVANGSSYTTSDNKVGDMFRVELVPTGDMKTGATSKYAKIGTKQDVNVVVTATPDKQYQLSNVKLTAVVEAAETDATVKPSGSVTFYYTTKDTDLSDNTWTQVGETKTLSLVDGKISASIDTTELPVNNNGYVKQDLVIVALYSGDDAFNAITSKTDTKIDEEEVTIYSSVVFDGASANVGKTATQAASLRDDTTKDIIAYVVGDDMKVGDAVSLKVTNAYTLDWDAKVDNGYGNMVSDTGTIDGWAKLQLGTDYTVEWQYLANANAYSSYATANWQPLNVEGDTCNITVQQGYAYRAKITVAETAPVLGSFNELDQNGDGDKDDKTDGRKEYFSNVLVPANGQTTITTNVTTDKQGKGYEGIVEDVETVTIHTYVSGATNPSDIPIAEITAMILNTATPADPTQPAANEIVKNLGERGNLNGYTSFTWEPTEPGIYTLWIKAVPSNGYETEYITRELIVRANNYAIYVDEDTFTYDGTVKGLEISISDECDDFDAIAEKAWSVTYKDEDGNQVEPTQAGTYKAVITLPESAYWTEKVVDTYELKIKPRKVEIVDLVAQAKVYDGTTDANLQEIVLGDAKTLANGAVDPAYKTGVINGDSVYAVGKGILSGATAGTQTLSWVKDGEDKVTLKGDDADNYELVEGTYTGESINVQRSQVQGDIADATYKYTGKDIQIDKATEIYLIDQAGKRLADSDIDVTYYYHNGNGVEKVSAMNKLGMYTVIARPDQGNYKGGAAQKVYVVSGDGNNATANDGYSSALINITNTVKLYGAAGNTGVTVTATKGTATASYYYDDGTTTGWHTTAPTAAGRYLVKVTATTAYQTDVAYGLYTIVKARPEISITATGGQYTSGRVGSGAVSFGTASDNTAKVYYTFSGETAIGSHMTDSKVNVDFDAPTQVGDYIVTAHVGETDNYTAHEVSATFSITKKPLTISVMDQQREQFGTFPQMIAQFNGLATGGVAPDTSISGIEIQPELHFISYRDQSGNNSEFSGYQNPDMNMVGAYKIKLEMPLATNYAVTPVDGELVVTATDPKPALAIHGMPYNGEVLNAEGGMQDIVYFGDKIQLYAYGNTNAETDVTNPSSTLTWSSSDETIAKIDGTKGLMEIVGVGGPVTITLVRGKGTDKIETQITFTALPKEVSVHVADQDKVFDNSTQTYNGTVTTTDGSASVVSGNTRKFVGSQIVTYQVNPTGTFVSETYGGLFTINDKEVTVTPGAQTTVYGTAETYNATKYTEDGIVGGVAALSNAGVASVADAYANLDVLDGYEILVAGVENKNYNVKYITDQDAPDAQVTAKPLTFKTGVINSDGRTSGYMEDNSLFYKDEGYAITGTTFNPTPNDRMYGEVNPVMDYLFDELIAGDSEADLVSMLDWLVEYSAGANKHNIKADANVKFNNSHLSVSGHRADPTDDASYISNDADDVYVIDGMLTTGGVKNYTITVDANEATQNIYQRPVTLSVPTDMTLTVYKPSIYDGNTLKSNAKETLKQLLLNNLIVGEYGGKGGLATLLGHTIEDLGIKVTAVSSIGANGMITVTIALTNTNYWTENLTFNIKVDPTKIVATYGPLGWTSATVTMIGVDANGDTTGPVDVSGDVRYLIYVKDTSISDSEQKYSHYKNLTPVRSVTMTYGGSDGYYIANYDRLSAGDYVMFAIVEGYTIIE